MESKRRIRGKGGERKGAKEIWYKYKHRNWKHYENVNSETMAQYSCLWLFLLNFGNNPRIPHQDWDTQIPAVICGSVLFSFCWADLCGVLSSSSLRHQPGHHHNTSHACALQKETHSSSRCEWLWFYQWPNPFLLDHSLIMYIMTNWCCICRGLCVVCVTLLREPDLKQPHLRNKN